MRGSSRISWLAAFLVTVGVHAERVPYAPSAIEPPTPEWLAQVEAAAPARPAAEGPERRILVFSLRTGYKHDVIPHVDRMLRILGEKSGAFSTEVSTDIESLTPEALRRFDVLALNNNCSAGPRRNLFLDELESNPRYAELDSKEREARARALEQSVLDFVSDGKGLVVIHGALTLLNNSPEFTSMIGAAFDYHPPSQEVTLRPVEPDHPLLAAFRGQGPLIHRDEPYCFKGAYETLSFRPLLEMEVEGLKDPRGKLDDAARYVAWIKPYGEGRVFYCSPSHFPASYTSPTLLKFLLAGIQYAAGDLSCEDGATSADP